MKNIIQNNNKKLIAIWLLIMLFIPIMVSLNELARDREHRQNDSIKEIAQQWGDKQAVSGPYIVVPYAYNNTNYHYFAPEDLNIEANIETDSRSRGIYNVPVYNADVKLTGNFSNIGALVKSESTRNILSWDQAHVVIGVYDMHGLNEVSEFKFNGQALEVKNENVRSGFESITQVNPGQQKIDFDISFKLQGSQVFYADPIGNNTNVDIKSDWATPSFNGSFIPTSHNITSNGFEANWKVLDLNTNSPRYWNKTNAKDINVIDSSAVNSYNTSIDTFGVEFFIENDVYNKTKRAVKYGMAIVVLVFVTFFMIETIANKRVHPFQYLLIGLALAIFYTLLLSLAEYIPFVAAYIIAAVSIIGMITMFAKAVLKDSSLAYKNGVLLTILYSFIFLLLQSKDYTLLIGSIGLFLILAAVMHFSLKIDWYKDETTS